MKLSQVSWGVLVLAACGSDSDDKRFGAPNLEAAIEATIPAGLGGQRRLPGTDDSTPAGAIEGFFVDPVSTIDPDPDVQGSAMGVIKGDVRNLTVRMDGADVMSAGSPCLDATPMAHPIDLSSVSPALALTLNLQCISIDPNQPIGGTVYGHSGASYSMWSTVVGGTSDVRGYVSNTTTDPMNNAKIYDFLRLEDSPSLTRITAYHVKGDVDANKFELTYASADPSTRLWCGFRMISDGTHVYAAGKHLPSTAGTDCATATEFTLCATASPFAVVSDASACAALATSFTMPAFTQASVATAASAIDAAVNVSSASAHATPE